MKRRHDDVKGVLNPPYKMQLCLPYLMMSSLTL